MIVTDRLQLDPRCRVALAFGDALEDVLSKFASRTPSAYFYGARRNIAHGDRASIGVNLPRVVQEVERLIEGVWARADVTDHLRGVFRAKLRDPKREEIMVASLLLSRWVGGDAETYARTWHDIF